MSYREQIFLATHCGMLSSRWFLLEMERLRNLSKRLSASKSEEIFGVYGGLGSLADLKPEMQVWVWFENFKRPKEDSPVAAYFQFFIRR